MADCKPRKQCFALLLLHHLLSSYCPLLLISLQPPLLLSTQHPHFKEESLCVALAVLELYRPGWPQTQEIPSTFCFPSAGIKGLSHHPWPKCIVKTTVASQRMPIFCDVSLPSIILETVRDRKLGAPAFCLG